MGRLTQYDREQIEAYFRQGLSGRQIAKLIGRHHSVVERELKRNRSPHFAYEAQKAKFFSQRRARKTNTRKLLKDEDLREYVEEKLYEGWSPEQIAGRLKTNPPLHLKNKTISYEAIYQFVYEIEPWLYHQLRYKHSDRRKHYSRKCRKVIIPGKVSIHERPKEINKKEEVGHFESDTMSCKGKKQALSVQYERVIRLVRIHRIRGFNAEETKDALCQTIFSLPENFTKSITFDNGGEAAKHTEVKRKFCLKTYFCDPYASWQKGGVENMNGLLREYLPRKLNLEKVTNDQLFEIQERLNNRPRKSLNYQTPNEKIQSYINKVAH